MLASLEQTQARERTKDSDNHKIPILRHAFENVQLPIQAPAVERVEDLREYQRIENKRPHNAIVVPL